MVIIFNSSYTERSYWSISVSADSTHLASMTFLQSSAYRSLRPGIAAAIASFNLTKQQTPYSNTEEKYGSTFNSLREEGLVAKAPQDHARSRSQGMDITLFLNSYSL